MNIYSWALIYINIYAILFGWISNKKLSKILFIASVSIHLIIIQGFRSISVGGDLINYLEHYRLIQSADNVIEASQFGRFEIGYNLLTYILGDLGLSFQNFMTLTSIFNIVILGYILYKYSKLPYISYIFFLIIGVYDFQFSGLRQSIAMTWILLSFQYIVSKKLLKFLLTILLAVSFHVTALPFIIIYFLVNTRIRQYYKYLYPILFGVLLILGKQIGILATLYMNPEYISYMITSSELLGTTAILILVILISAIIIKKMDINLVDDMAFDSSFIIVSVALLVQALSSYSYLFTRFNLIYFQFSIILVPYIFFHFSTNIGKQNKWARTILTLSFNLIFFALSFLYYDNLLDSNPHFILPHVFFWQ